MKQLIAIDFMIMKVVNMDYSEDDEYIDCENVDIGAMEEFERFDGWHLVDCLK